MVGLKLPEQPRILHLGTCIQVGLCNHRKISQCIHLLMGEIRFPLSQKEQKPWSFSSKINPVGTNYSIEILPVIKKSSSISPAWLAQKRIKTNVPLNFWCVGFLHIAPDGYGFCVRTEDSVIENHTPYLFCHACKRCIEILAKKLHLPHAKYGANHIATKNIKEIKSWLHRVLASQVLFFIAAKLTIIVWGKAWQWSHHKKLVNQKS